MTTRDPLTNLPRHSSSYELAREFQRTAQQAFAQHVRLTEDIVRLITRLEQSRTALSDSWKAGSRARKIESGEFSHGPPPLRGALEAADDHAEDTQRYRSRAAEIRAHATSYSPDNREIMLKIADDYDEIAKALEDIARS